MPYRPFLIRFDSLRHREIFLAKDGSVGIGWPETQIIVNSSQEAFGLAIRGSEEVDEAIITGTDINKPMLCDLRTKTVQGNIDIPAEDGTFGVAASSDGKYIAVADGHEHIFILHGNSKELISTLSGGERTLSLAFDESRQRLISACSFQGGADIAFHRLADTGVQVEFAISRSDINSMRNVFVDTLASLAVSFDGHWLGIFETSAI